MLQVDAHALESLERAVPISLRAQRFERCFLVEGITRGGRAQLIADYLTSRLLPRGGAPAPKTAPVPPNKQQAPKTPPGSRAPRTPSGMKIPPPALKTPPAPKMSPVSEALQPVGPTAAPQALLKRLDLTETSVLKPSCESVLGDSPVNSPLLDSQISSRDAPPPQ